MSSSENFSIPSSPRIDSLGRADTPLQFVQRASPSPTQDQRGSGKILIRPALRGRLGALHPSLTRTSPPPHAFSQNPAAGLKLIFFSRKRKAHLNLAKCHRRRHIRTPSPRTAPSPRRIRLLLLCFADERNASATAARDGPLRAAQAARDLRAAANAG